MPSRFSSLPTPCPSPLSAGRWYLGVFNADVTNVAGHGAGLGLHQSVSGHHHPGQRRALCRTNAGPASPADYFRFVVTTNAVRAQFEINHPGADFTLVARRGLPLPDLASFDLSSANPGTNDELIVLYDYSSPVQLTPGEWFLSAVNLSGGPAAYAIMASEFPVYGTNLVISQCQAASNSFCLTWSSVPGIHYGVQGRTNITDPDWDTISPTLTATNTSTSWCLPLPSPYHFFRIREGLVLVPDAPPPPPQVLITRVCYSTNGVLLQWTAPTNSQFGVQWTPCFPPTWADFADTVLSTNGDFSFLDDGSQTGGLGPARFYRLRLLP